MNLLASESMTTKKNETFYLNYIAFTNIISGMEMATVAIVISNYESLDLLSWYISFERDLIHDSEEGVPMITNVY